MNILGPKGYWWRHRGGAAEPPQALGWAASAGCKGLSSGSATGPYSDFAEFQSSSDGQIVAGGLRPHRWASPVTRAANSARIAQVGKVLATEGIVLREASPKLAT